MDVSTAVEQRRSTRHFAARPVDQAILLRVFAQAGNAPSGGNLQPWHATVLAGDRLADLRRQMQVALQAPPGSEMPEYRIYPENLPDPWRSRRSANGEAMYASVGIGRDDRGGRMAQVMRNFTFFDAPVGAFVHMPRIMGPPQWADVGMWLQTVMLLLVEQGLASCAQEAWSAYPDTVKRVAGIPDDHVLFCGLAIGWPEPDAAINRFANPRVALEDTVRFLD
ncbi:nitroreductase [Croceicoccus sp. F390]|uniref:Nitroreductase n=1 Tax=Croceicoccus esteveae TaxID=3075597 RepID=A0ABU2ZHE0_9SPHN|nr:nitroreductase [Croceicoccus sp. F390]MDT0576013.1 nitroreductase [Croceicoccus sp. F390]